ncbi:MAG: acetyl-CoA acetyltransferase [Actinomycetota bacterium]
MDPRTPVIVGVGQVTNRRERTVDVLTLMEEAVRAADLDAGGRALSQVGSIQILSSVSKRYGSSATTLGTRLGIPDGERITTTVGGSTPQWLISQACDRIVAGELDGVLIAGGEALDSARRAAKEGITFDADEEASDQDTLIGDDRPPVSDAEIRAGVIAPAQIYPMFEQALAARDGRTPAEQRQWLGDLMSRFTAVAARNADHAWFPIEREPSFISEVSADNRMIAEPYTKNLNAIIQVDMAAAIIVLSASAAEAAGVPRDRWVFPWTGAKADDVYLVSERPVLTEARGIAAAAAAGLDTAGISIDDVSHVDIYSCFPSAVQMGAAALGLQVDDPRGLTVTGGLSFFGGPGNNYMTHSISVMAGLMREDPSRIGVVTGVSWYMSKHTFGIYSATPPKDGWRAASTSDAQATIDATALEIASRPDGDAVVDAFTVEHDRDTGPARAAVYATLADGRRAIAKPARPSIPMELTGRSIVGAKVRISSGEGGTVYEI